jgi:hypothetical protein
MPINVAANHERDAPRLPRAGRWLVAAAVGLLVGAGGLLWWRRGSAVFNDFVSAAIAWCF